MIPDGDKNGWALEIVRGRDAGKRYALGGGVLVLGNDPGGTGIDLADQEGTSPRRMAAKQAQVESSPGGLSLHDLDSPGGTFVNRQRVLPGQRLSLRDGDVIQLGAVQLRVVHAGAATKPSPPPPPPPLVPPKPSPPPPVAKSSVPPAPRAAPVAFVFTLKDGPTCRSWDDFLTISAQRWAALREELTTGRLAAFLASIGRKELTPTATGTPDERLDAWLGGLPAIKGASPEIDVHPATLAIKVTGGGGTTRRALRVSNVGYRLLRATARVEPPETPWLRLPPEFDGRPFAVVEGTDVSIEVHPPDWLPGALAAAIVFGGNGGQLRVPVTLERAERRDAIPEAAPASVGSTGRFRDLVARQSVATRLVAWPLAAVAARGLILAGNLALAGPSASPMPTLHGPAALFAVAGAILGVVLALRGGAPGDALPAGFTGGVLGAFLAAMLVALCRAIEPGGGPVVALVIWALLGAALAGLSAWLVPAHTAREAPR